MLLFVSKLKAATVSRKLNWSLPYQTIHKSMNIQMHGHRENRTARSGQQTGGTVLFSVDVFTRSETLTQREEQHTLSLCCIIEDECWVRSGMSACWIIYVATRVGPYPVMASRASGNPAPPFLSYSLPSLLSVWFTTSPPWNRSRLLKVLVCFYKPCCFLGPDRRAAF